MAEKILMTTDTDVEFIFGYEENMAANPNETVKIVNDGGNRSITFEKGGQVLFTTSIKPPKKPDETSAIDIGEVMQFMSNKMEEFKAKFKLD